MIGRTAIRIALLLLATGPALTFGKLSPEQIKTLPPPANHRIDFSQEIKPIFEASCIKCHGRGKSKGGFALDNRALFVKGGDSGPAAVEGRSAESLIVELVSGIDPDNVMPKKGSKLSPAQIGALRAWIDQGLIWDQEITFGKPAPLNLVPRKPEFPLAKKSGLNPIDRFLEAYYKTNHIQAAAPVNDRLFIRRAYLDILGILPPPEAVEKFAIDRSAKKREVLANHLLSDNRHYAEHWLTFWNDALRNDYKGTGYIDGGRKQITPWLYSALATNMPYNEFVSSLINPSADSEGFAKGIVWRGVVNASQAPEMQAAQNISQVFMGVNIKCASCHDSFINDWTLADSYGLASIYADGPMEMYQCEKPVGKKSQMKFLFPELGEIDQSAARPQRLKQLAEIITKKEDGRLTRTIVNRIWAKLMGRGLVEPLDDMDRAAWNQDILDWLANDLANDGYDLKKLIATIVTSKAYQLPTMPASELISKDYVFRGPLVRRLSAEQYLDALAAITGVGNGLPAMQMNFDVGDAEAGTFARAPKWIWNNPAAAEAASPETVFFKRIIEIGSRVEASIVCVADNSFKLFVNGKEAASGRDFNRPTVADITPYLVMGPNIFAVSAINEATAPAEKKTEANKEVKESPLPSPAGLMFYARIRGQRAGESLDFASDHSWFWRREAREGWEKNAEMGPDWKPAVELGGLEMGPWRIEKKFAQAYSTAELCGHARASLVGANPLMTAMGRPNREQVVTSRASAATTLQALELTNGSTLAQQLKKGAANLLAELPAAPDKVVTALYQRSLNRKPTEAELALSRKLIGNPVQAEGVEDLLWAVTMLPEFQLIY